MTKEAPQYGDVSREAVNSDPEPISDAGGLDEANNEGGASMAQEDVVELSASGEGADDTERPEAEAVSDGDIIEQLREELATAQAQAEEHLDRLQRTAAEFQNARKRQERQLTESIDRANADLIRRLLPVLDDLDLAFQNAPADVVVEGEAEAQTAEQAWVAGFRQIRKKLLDLLQEQGVTPIDTDGEFDPSRHEAVLSEPSDEVESGHIVGVLRGGYEYKGQVLRPAMVRVAI